MISIEVRTKYGIAADLVRMGVVFVLLLLVCRNPLGNQAIRGILLAEAVGLFVAFFLNPERWNLASLGELAFLAGLWWLQDRLGGAAAEAGFASGGMVPLFFLLWLPLRVLPGVVRALRPGSGLFDEE